MVVVGEEKRNELVSEFWTVQPEPGSVADQLIKKGEARGITQEKGQFSLIAGTKADFTLPRVDANEEIHEFAGGSASE